MSKAINITEAVTARRLYPVGQLKEQISITDKT